LPVARIEPAGPEPPVWGSFTGWTVVVAVGRLVVDGFGLGLRVGAGVGEGVGVGLGGSAGAGVGVCVWIGAA